MLAWKRYTASDVNLIAGGEMKVTGSAEGKQFFDDGYWSRELLAWSLPKLTPAEALGPVAEGMISISKAHAHSSH